VFVISFGFACRYSPWSAGGLTSGAKRALLGMAPHWECSFSVNAAISSLLLLDKKQILHDLELLDSPLLCNLEPFVVSKSSIDTCCRTVAATEIRPSFPPPKPLCSMTPPRLNNMTAGQFDPRATAIIQSLRAPAAALLGASGYLAVFLTSQSGSRNLHNRTIWWIMALFQQGVKKPI